MGAIGSGAGGLGRIAELFCGTAAEANAVRLPEILAHASAAPSVITKRSSRSGSRAFIQSIPGAGG